MALGIITGLYSSVLPLCAGFGWDRVNFPHSSWYGGIFCICAESCVDNAVMFSLTLSSVCTPVRSFLPLTSPHQQVRNVGGHSWDTGLCCPKGYPTPCGIMLNSQNSRESFVEQGTLGMLVLVFPGDHCTHDGALLSGDG